MSITDLAKERAKRQAPDENCVVWEMHQGEMRP